MKNSRDLKGIACGVAESFISRNNDVSGYWGIGMLYQEAIEHSTALIQLDLLTGLTQPDAFASKSVSSHYSTYLAKRLAGQQIVAARINLEFGTFGSSMEPKACSYGDPFVCTVTLVATTGRTYTCARGGRCKPHSARERRSTRGGL
jgi:hypothetical protein